MNELLYQLALTQVPNIGDIQARILVKHFGNAHSIFKAKPHSLNKIKGLGALAKKSIIEFTNFDLVEKELDFIEKNNISSLFFTDPAYPPRLLHCIDAPIMLFLKGEIDMRKSKFISVVGTRAYSDYGKLLTENLIRDISSQDIVIVSGLAYGIDAIAHKEALKNNLRTIGVVAHGLDMVYPSDHNKLASNIVQAGGGLVSEFFSGTIPDKHHFPLRNRIVAGISDATIVIETAIKGGSMITAKLADSYNRDVFAAPGRTTDKTSTGCNYLIKNNKAIMFTGADDILREMGWVSQKKEDNNLQRALFIELTDEEKKVMRLLQEKESVHIDELNLSSGLSTSNVASAILNLELQNIIKSMPGKMYKLM